MSSVAPARSLRQACIDVLDVLIVSDDVLQRVYQRMTDDPDGWFGSLNDMERSVARFAVSYAVLSVADLSNPPPAAPAVDRN